MQNCKVNEAWNIGHDQINDGCIQLYSSRCKVIPSFTNPTLIVPKKYSLTRKQFKFVKSLKNIDQDLIMIFFQLPLSKYNHEPILVTLAQKVPEKWSLISKLDANL